MFRTEESRVSIIILLTFAILLITGIYPQYVLWMTAGLLLIIVATGIYAAIIKKRYGEPRDERSERCSLKAARNGFLVAIVTTALTAVVIQVGSNVDIEGMINMVWGLSIAAYLLSYLYYKRVV